MSMSKNSIFVQIASYRDIQLIPTIESLLNNAKHPEMFTFGICWQYDEEEDTSHFDNEKNFRIKKYHYTESEGLGWARNITNKLYDGEKFTLQMDSHHRFAKDWDMMLLEDYRQASFLSKKPIISTYCTPFNPYSDSPYNEIPCIMSQYEFSNDKLLMSMPYYIHDHKTRSKVIQNRTISGHFYFVNAKFIEEVPYDPDIYFGGYTEETTLSVRAYTHGYDTFCPYRQYIWHEYTRNYRKKHWDDHGTKETTKQEKTSGERDIFSRNKTRQLFGQEDHGIDMGIYGLGTVRTLHDYEVFGGFDFKNCRIQDYTLKVKEPPNPEPWEDQFIVNQFKIVCEWDVDFFKKLEFKKPKFLTMGVLTRSGMELFRKDFTIENELEYVSLQNNKYPVTITSIDRPNKIVMYLFDEDKQWSERYEKIL
jgi:hypothetical protein